MINALLMAQTKASESKVAPMICSDLPGQRVDGRKG